MLGDSRLRQKCEPVQVHEINDLKSYASQMSELIRLFRKRYHAGRAIAAPQIGLMKRMVVIDIDQPKVLYNPVLSELSDDTFVLWDDCMSFPHLMVRLLRHRSCKVSYFNEEWQRITVNYTGDMAELIQHECDHLDGILAIDRALDRDSFKWRS